MPPIITLQFNSFSYSSLHNNLNTLHTVLDLTIPLLYITTQYHTSRHATVHYLCFTIRNVTVRHITSALPQITKRDRTLPQPNNASHYTTIPLLYNMLLYCTEPLYFNVTIDNITVRYYSEHNLCYTYNKAHHTTIPLLYDTLPCITVA